MPEDVSALELDAYLDGELDAERQLAVERRLAAEPEAAARLMRDMSVRTALRLAQPELDDVPALSAAARQLGERFVATPPNGVRRFLPQRWTALAAALAAVIGATAVVTMRDSLAAPIYVADAVQAYHTGLLRADMVSQVETTRLDPEDIRRFTRIRVPVLPPGWRITDVQLFPSDEGPALQVMIRTPDRRSVSIFAVRTAADAPSEPEALQRGATAVAYWRTGDIAYALTGTAKAGAMESAAQDLADNRVS